MKIRTIKENDFAVFREMCAEFYRSGATINPYDENTVSKTFRYLTSKHHNLFGYFIIGDDGKYAGYSLLTSYWCNEEGGNILVLDELYLSPASRHHGYAGHFLAWLEKAFSGRARALTLEVLNTNQSAQSLYRHEGLSPDGFVTYIKNLS